MPYLCFGPSPSFFDNPFTDQRGMHWIAETFLVISPDAVMTRVVQPVCGFRWGYSTEGERTAVLPLALWSSAWLAACEVLRERYAAGCSWRRGRRRRDGADGVTMARIVAVIRCLVPRRRLRAAGTGDEAAVRAASVGLPHVCRTCAMRVAAAGDGPRERTGGCCLCRGGWRGMEPVSRWDAGLYLDRGGTAGGLGGRGAAAAADACGDGAMLDAPELAQEELDGELSFWSSSTGGGAMADNGGGSAARSWRAGASGTSGLGQADRRWRQAFRRFGCSRGGSAQ